MKGKRRSSGQLARDRRCIADLYLRGWIQADIAEEVKLHQSTISRDIAAMQKDWLASALIDFNKAKAQELAKIDHLEREYWEAWARSCEDAETITEKARGIRGADKADSAEKITQRRGQAGDPRFLSGVQWCIEQRCKILGVEAPTKQALDLTTKGESLNVGYTDDERTRAMVSILAAFREDLLRPGGNGHGAMDTAERTPGGSGMVSS